MYKTKVTIIFERIFNGQGPKLYWPLLFKASGRSGCRLSFVCATRWPSPFSQDSRHRENRAGRFDVPPNTGAPGLKAGNRP